MFRKRKKEENKKIEKDNVPSHIAIIMDGNGRWAKKRGLPRSFGHREGGKTVKNIAKYCDSIGVKFLTLYAFSTENWKRPKSEVDYLMDLLVDYLVNIETHLEGKKIRVRVIGDRDGLSERVKEEIKRVQEKTCEYKGLTLTLAINYGAKREMIVAFKNLYKKIQTNEIRLEDVTQEDISQNLYTSFMPDPDILIRPGGECRLSNYLLWQCAYSEFYFVDTLWPDFSKKNMEKIILDFQTRDRRFGGVK